MKDIKDNFIKIFKEQRGLFWLMLLLFFSGLILIGYALLALDFGSSVVKVGYGDLDGYRDGSWLELLAFAVFGLILGLFHNLLAIRMFQKRGEGMAKVVVVVSILLVIGAILTLMRLTGEG